MSLNVTFSTREKISFSVSTFSFRILPQRGKNSICVEAQDKKSITSISGSTGLSRWLFQTLYHQFGYSSSVFWPSLLTSAQLMLTHIEEAEFNIGVDNLWLLRVVHHPRAIKPEKKLWISSAAMWKSPSSPHLTFSRSSFPRHECSQCRAREPEAIFHSLKHSFDFSSMVSKIFPHGSCHSHSMSQWVFTQKYKSLKTLTIHQPLNNEKIQLYVSRHILKFELAL